METAKHLQTLLVVTGCRAIRPRWAGQCREHKQSNSNEQTLMNGREDRAKAREG